MFTSELSLSLFITALDFGIVLFVKFTHEKTIENKDLIVNYCILIFIVKKSISISRILYL